MALHGKLSKTRIPYIHRLGADIICAVNVIIAMDISSFEARYSCENIFQLFNVG